MNFYKHFLGDYARDTAHLSMLEHGAYRLMLDHYYATGKPVPADKALLYRICKASSKSERAAVDLVSDAFFPVNGDGTRHNHRADIEIASAVAYAEAQSMRANKRWQMQADMPVHDQVQSPDDASHSHSHKEQKSKSLSGKPGLKTLTDLGVDEQIARDWLAVRKAKRAPMTDTALDELKLEAGKAGITVSEAVAICAKRSWQGFKASWNWREELPTPLASNIKRAAI